MKRRDSSKRTLISGERELEEGFREWLREDPDLKGRLKFLGQVEGSQRVAEGVPADLLPFDRVELGLDGRRIDFRVIYSLQPSRAWLEERKQGWAARSELPLLVVPELTARTVALCKDLEISAMDLNGRAWLRAPGLLVDRAALAGRNFRYELEPKNIFVGKSARVLRCLLADRDRVWRQGEIVPRTRASAGLVSRIVQHLIGQGFVEKVSKREFRLRDWQGLLDAWVEADRFARRNRTFCYASYAEPLKLAGYLQHWAAREDTGVAFTQWIAAWVRHPYAEPAVCSAYVARLPDAAALEKAGLRQVTEGGKLWLHVPDDPGVFLESRYDEKLELSLVTDAQIYLDLQRTGLRGPDAAAALREWEGFGRPNQ